MDRDLLAQRWDRCWQDPYLVMMSVQQSEQRLAMPRVQRWGSHLEKPSVIPMAPQKARPKETRSVKQLATQTPSPGMLRVT